MKPMTLFAGAAIGAAVTALATTSASAATMYNIRVLDAAPNQVDVYASGVNNAGQVVGYTVDANDVSTATLWNADGTRTPLPVLAAANPHAEAYRINNNGQIVGLARNNANVSQAAYWDANGVIGIGALNGTGNSFAQDINDNGVVAGSSRATTGQHAFTWTQAGGFVDYGSQNPNSNSAIAGWNGINNSGKMVGTAYILFSPFKASMGMPGDTQPTIISPPGQFSTGMGLAINDAGVMVGYQNGGSGNPHAAIFNGDGTFQDLGHLGLGESWAEDINNSGVIVGRAMGEDGSGNFVQRATVYEGGQMFELLTLAADSTGWTDLFQASGISDNGAIVGAGMFNGEIRAYIMTPVPEPTSVGALALAGAAMLARRRRH